MISNNCAVSSKYSEHIFRNSNHILFKLEQVIDNYIEKANFLQLVLCFPAFSLVLCEINYVLFCSVLYSTLLIFMFRLLNQNVLL